jgi:hypothetical protein
MTALPAISLEILQRVIPLIFIPFERLVALKTGRKRPANAAPKHRASVGRRHGKKPHQRQHKQRNRGMKTGSGRRCSPHCQHATGSSRKAHREIRSKQSSRASSKRAAGRMAAKHRRRRQSGRNLTICHLLHAFAAGNRAQSPMAGSLPIGAPQCKKQ